MHRIAVVMPHVGGGVKTITKKLVYGLRREGFNVTIFPLNRNTILATFEDVKRMPHLNDFDTVIYMGSTPQISAIFAKENTTTILFVHGFLQHEIVNTLASTSTSVKDKLLGAYILTLWNINKALKTIDYYICHSITACEENKINENFVLLPQFIFLEEIELYHRLKQQFLIESTQKPHETIIVTYTSTALSPRLLQSHDIIRLMNIIAKKLDKRLKLIVIDPRIEVEELKTYGNLMVHFSKTLPRYKFLELLLNADLYIEPCIDEELRLASIEAALLGVPIAKITHAKFIDRQDYDDEVLWASTTQEFIDLIIEYLRDKERWKHYYARKLLSFLIAQRNWDKIKRSLLNILIS
jgi:hypothetical protein